VGNEIDILVRSRDEGLDRTTGRVHAFGNAGVTAGGKIRGGLGLAAKGMAGLGVGVAGLALLAGPKLLDLGVKMEAIGNKTRTVFGSSVPIVTSWADKVSQKMGLTSKEAQGLAAGLGDLLTPMGFTQRQAATMSTKIADLSGAFAQWSNGTLDTEGAANMLSDALTGEYDSLKSVGVQIDANTVKQLMHAKGYDKLTGAAAKQKEAEVVLAEITRQSSNAIKAYEGGTNKLALAKNKLTSQVNTLKERLATALIPAMAKAAEWASAHLPGALSATMHALGNTGHAIGNTIHAFGNIVHAGGNVVHAFGNIFHAAGNVGHALGNVWHAATNVGHAFSNVWHAAGNVGHAFSNVGHAAGNVWHAATNVGHAFANAGRAIGGAASSLWSFVHGGEEMVSILPAVLRGLGAVAGAGGGGGGGKAKAAFAHGGIASGLTEVGEHGSEFLDLPAGTRVIPHGTARNMTGGGGSSVVRIEFNSGGSRLDDLLVELMRKAVRVRGGVVQTVIGSS
jgi:hypothetical protein